MDERCSWLSGLYYCITIDHLILKGEFPSYSFCLCSLLFPGLFLYPQQQCPSEQKARAELNPGSSSWAQSSRCGQWPSGVTAAVAAPGGREVLLPLEPLLLRIHSPASLPAAGHTALGHHKALDLRRNQRDQVRDSSFLPVSFEFHSSFTLAVLWSSRLFFSLCTRKDQK